jgi:hypothetical protein
VTGGSSWALVVGLEALTQPVPPSFAVVHLRPTSLARFSFANSVVVGCALLRRRSLAARRVVSPTRAPKKFPKIGKKLLIPGTAAL